MGRWNALSFHTSVIGDQSVVSHNFMADKGHSPEAPAETISPLWTDAVA